jgi:peptidylprolyl isomerase
VADQHNETSSTRDEEGDPRKWFVVAGVAALVVVAILVFASTDDGSESTDVATEAPAEQVATTTPAIPETVPAVDPPTECAPAAPIPPGVVDGKPETVDLPEVPPTTDVETTVLREGDGPETTDVSYVTVDYVGVSCTTGEQFDSSWDNGAPITVAIGNAPPTETAFTVIPGWSNGLIGQRQGSLVQIDIPPALAYGPEGRAPIPPNDPLTFVVDILEVSDTPPA